MNKNKIIEQKGAGCLSKIYKREILSDFTIINNGKKYGVHKIILALSIPYFEKMFTTDMVESTSNELTLDRSTKALEMIIAWSYGQPITLTSDNVRELAELADYMSIPELISECLTFLYGYSAGSIFSDFSNFINYKGTRKLVESYICANFCDIVSTDEFVTYDFDTINDILSLENLNIETELDVFDAIIKWITADPQHRLDHLGELMKKIYWISVDKTKLMDVASNNYVKSSESARAVIKAAIELIAFDVSEESKKRKLIHRTRQNQKRLTMLLDRSCDHGIYFKTSDENLEFVCFFEDDKLIKFKPKFFEADLVDYNINSSQVIRIDSKHKKYKLYDNVWELYSCLFGYLFAFDIKPRRVELREGIGYTELGKIPDDCSSLMSIAPYKGHFYIVVKEKECECGFNFKISKFDPIKNVWTNLSKAPDPVPRRCTKVIMKINNGKVLLFFGRNEQDVEYNGLDLFITSIVKHWIYYINEASWSENKEFVSNSKSDPEIVKNLSNEIQCSENQLELFKRR